MQIDFNALPRSVREQLVAMAPLGDQKSPPFVLGRAGPPSTWGERRIALLFLFLLWGALALFGVGLAVNLGNPRPDAERMIFAAAVLTFVMGAAMCAQAMVAMMKRLGRTLPYREWGSILTPSYLVSLKGEKVTLTPTRLLGPVTVTAFVRYGRPTLKRASVAGVMFDVPGCVDAEQSARAFEGMRTAVSVMAAQRDLAGLYALDPLVEVTLQAGPFPAVQPPDGGPRVLPSALERGPWGAVLLAVLGGIPVLGALTLGLLGHQSASMAANAARVSDGRDRPAAAPRRDPMGVVMGRYTPRAASPEAIRWMRSALNASRAALDESTPVSVQVVAPSGEAAMVAEALAALSRARRVPSYTFVEPSTYVSREHPSMAMGVASRLNRDVGELLGPWSRARAIHFVAGAEPYRPTVTVQRAPLVVERLARIRRDNYCPLFAMPFQVTLWTERERLTRTVTVPAPSMQAVVASFGGSTLFTSEACVRWQATRAAEIVGEQAAGLLVR